MDDLPEYPVELVAIVDRSIAELPADVAWLTYRDVGKRFGVSRATIARRLKDGLVPGVRIHDGCVLGDGSVRRSDASPTEDEVRGLMQQYADVAGAPTEAQPMSVKFTSVSGLAHSRRNGRHA